jgi:hypothetical protein
VGKIARGIVVAWARRGRDFAHADEPSAAPCPPYGCNARPHPEEARSAVSKDEASDPFALMLRDAARVRAAPQHEGGLGPA